MERNVLYVRLTKHASIFHIKTKSKNTYVDNTYKINEKSGMMSRSITCFDNFLPDF